MMIKIEADIIKSLSHPTQKAMFSTACKKITTEDDHKIKKQKLKIILLMIVATHYNLILII